MPKILKPESKKLKKERIDEPVENAEETSPITTNKISEEVSHFNRVFDLDNII